jgi:TonB family protein
MGVTGVVVVKATVETDGTVQNATVLEGHRLLRQSALDAVAQWLFTPGRLIHAGLADPLRTPQHVSQHCEAPAEKLPPPLGASLGRVGGGAIRRTTDSQLRRILRGRRPVPVGARGSLAHVWHCV